MKGGGTCPPRAVAWIQDLLELVCREGRDRGEGEAEAGPGQPIGAGEDQLESSRDAGNMMKDSKEFIWDVMQEDQQPTE